METLSKKQIKILNVVVDGEWKLNPNTGLVDVNGGVNFTYRELYKFGILPIAFGEVSGFFLIENLGLKTLQGCPYKVGDGFFCGHNKLTSLKYAPNYIGGLINCRFNQLSSIDWVPEHLGRHLIIDLENINKKYYGVIISELDNLIENGVKLYQPENNYYPYRNAWLQQQIYSLIESILTNRLI